MKGKLDLIISDPPLTLLMIDHYQKKKPIWKQVCALEEKEYIGLLKWYSKSSQDNGKVYFFCACAVMEMINLSLCT